jgi:hypothetical protein
MPQGVSRRFSTIERKIFDPADGFGSFTKAGELTDATLAKRGDQWWMFLAGEAHGNGGIELFSASLPPGATLSVDGWRLTAHPEDPTNIAPLAGHSLSKAWDLKGGRHCPAYIRGFDPQKKTWVERVYYAGAPANPWGPYSIGYLEWDGSRWADQEKPVFLASEAWEHGSVYESNVLYDDGKWKMWYVAGSNYEDYLVQGYSESEDGASSWSAHKVFAPAEGKVFDFHPFKTAAGYEAVFSRVWLGKTSPPEETGLWWCRADTLSSNFSDWSDSVQIMTAEDRGWHAGPWRPCARYSEKDPNKMLVFFDGGYAKKNARGFPYAFTLGCLEVNWQG